MLTPRLQNRTLQNNDSHNGGYGHLSFIMYIVYNLSAFVCFSCLEALTIKPLLNILHFKVETHWYCTENLIDQGIPYKQALG